MRPTIPYRMHYDFGQVYQPEADTYLLLDAALKEVRPGDRVLEVGSGSGLIATEVRKGARTIATDINPHAVICAHKAGVDVVRTDLVEAIRGRFDLILFNPPYLPTEPHERIDDWLEYALDGGKTGRATIERFAADAGRVLAPRGRILLLVSSLTGLDEVKELFQTVRYTVDVIRQERVEDEMLYVLRIHR
ncbi:MAG: HemK2/MTQ2 family protein methyltransferase [Methanoregula sp.]